jgi:hypothetical protein
MRPTAFEHKRRSKYRSEFSIQSSFPHGVKTPSNSKLIPDWITKLQSPTKKDVTLISLGSGPGVRYKEHPFPTKI